MHELVYDIQLANLIFFVMSVMRNEATFDRICGYKEQTWDVLRLLILYSQGGCKAFGVGRCSLRHQKVSVFERRIKYAEMNSKLESWLAQ